MCVHGCRKFVGCPLFVARCRVLWVVCLLLGVCCALCIVRRVLFVVWWSLLVARCALSLCIVVWCVMFVVCNV